MRARNAEIEQKIFFELNKAYQKKLIAGKNPNGVAAAITYLVCKRNKIKITQKQVANAANASDVTLRKSARAPPVTKWIFTTGSSPLGFGCIIPLMDKT
jgi:transcription initiation factor TFIIIB Brf1 subunit/transcription initiation factor TFIIB